MFCIQTFLFKYDIITSYMEDFSAFKYTTITELFYVIISYHIYTNVYYSLRPIFFVLFEKSNFLRKHHLLSCLLFKNV